MYAAKKKYDANTTRATQVQARSLAQGAKLARVLNDPLSALSKTLAAALRADGGETGRAAGGRQVHVRRERRVPDPQALAVRLVAVERRRAADGHIRHGDLCLYIQVGLY